MAKPPVIVLFIDRHTDRLLYLTMVVFCTISVDTKINDSRGNKTINSQETIYKGNRLSTIKRAT